MALASTPPSPVESNPSGSRRCRLAPGGSRPHAGSAAEPLEPHATQRAELGGLYLAAQHARSVRSQPQEARLLSCGTKYQRAGAQRALGAGPLPLDRLSARGGGRAGWRARNAARCARRLVPFNAPARSVHLEHCHPAAFSGAVPTGGGRGGAAAELGGRGVSLAGGDSALSAGAGTKPLPLVPAALRRQSVPSSCQLNQTFHESERLGM
eukprot:scaffold65150_cov67-Phaeocystis_antarctica.AAC.5